MRHLLSLNSNTKPRENTMDRRAVVACLALLCVAGMFTAGCNGSGNWFGQNKTPLWNGQDFNGWAFYLEQPDVQPEDVWSIRDGVIHCKGTPFGYVRTRDDYNNYALHLEWRWVPQTLPEGVVRNSGVFLHVQEPDMIWPKAIEAQLMHRNAGDFWIFRGAQVDQQKDVGSVPKQKPCQEKPLGQWNTYEVRCDGNTITLHVNGVKMNHVTGANIAGGKIALQSEGAPIEFRNIYITPLQ